MEALLLKGDFDGVIAECERIETDVRAHVFCISNLFFFFCTAASPLMMMMDAAAICCRSCCFAPILLKAACSHLCFFFSLFLSLSQDAFKGTFTSAETVTVLLLSFLARNELLRA